MAVRPAHWLRFAIVAIVAAWSIAAVLAQCWSPQHGHPAAHPIHPLAAAVGAEFVVNTNHAHFSDDSTPPCPSDFATAPLPRSESTAFAADVVSSAPVATDTYAHRHTLAGRGPPGGLPRSGRDLLIRYCLTRR